MRDEGERVRGIVVGGGRKGEEAEMRYGGARVRRISHHTPERFSYQSVFHLR